MYFDDSMAQVACLTIPEPKNPNSEPEKTVEKEKFSMVSDDLRVLYILGFQPAFLGISVWGCCFQAYFSTSLGWDLDSIILPRPWMKCEICADLREKPLGTGHSLTNKVLWHHHSDSMRYKVRLKGVYQECWKMLYCFFFFPDCIQYFFWICRSRIPWEYPQGKPHLPSKTCHHRRPWYLETQGSQPPRDDTSDTQWWWGLWNINLWHFLDPLWNNPGFQ